MKQGKPIRIGLTFIALSAIFILSLMDVGAIEDIEKDGDGEVWFFFGAVGNVTLWCGKIACYSYSRHLPHLAKIEVVCI